jgi:carbon-monoxide dehydrogenase catalytic subunit
VTFTNRSIDPAAQQMLVRAQDLGVKTTWDRFDDMRPHCGFGELGVCCDICYMGPCRIDPFGERAQVGVCGADAHLIVARNFARAVAAGAAAHSDHGREVVEALASGYPIANPEKLNALAAEYGVEVSGLAALPARAWRPNSDCRTAR